MPTYDYKCDDCGYAFEIFQGMLEKKLTKCPKCTGRVKRLIGTGAGIVFKGSGFYQTDYRSTDYKKRSEADAKGPKPSTKDGGSSTEAKSKAAPESSPKKPAPAKPTPSD
jgi:putative FmdB family regulatory protein